jgi:hypothetical protein
MAETLLSARTFVRLLAADTDTVDPALSDAEWNMMINSAFLDYARQYPEQFTTSATSPMAAITLTTGTFVYNVTTGAGVVEFTGAVITNTTFVEQNSLDRSDFGELYRLAKQEVNASGTYPRSWAVRRITDTQHQFVVYPSPAALVNGHFVYVFGYKEPSQLSSDSATFAQIADSEVKWVARLAAIRGCGIIGRSAEYIERLWSDLPQKMQASMRKVESFKRPHPKGSEVVT